MKELTEKTLIPIGLAVMTIGGGAVWLTTMYLRLDATASEVREIKSDQNTYLEDVHGIREDIQEIKGELKRIKK